MGHVYRSHKWFVGEQIKWYFPVSDISILHWWISDPKENEAAVWVYKRKAVKRKWKKINSLNTYSVYSSLPQRQAEQTSFPYKFRLLVFHYAENSSNKMRHFVAENVKRIFIMQKWWGMSQIHLKISFVVWDRIGPIGRLWTIMVGRSRKIIF